jgi:hypothetical protein
MLSGAGTMEEKLIDAGLFTIMLPMLNPLREQQPDAARRKREAASEELEDQE